jgi:small subunit ribosomal protein S14
VLRFIEVFKKKNVILLRNPDINFMAKTSVIARAAKKPKFSTRAKNRCFRCGRGKGFMRDFGLCRICFRELANEGMLPGVRKSSW